MNPTGTKLKKWSIYAGLSILLLGDFGFAYFSMKINQAKRKPNETLAADEHQLQLMKLDVKRASEIRARIPRVNQEFDQIESALPLSTVGYSTVDQELTQYAKDTRLQVEERKFHQKELLGRPLTEVEIEWTVVGDYAGIVRFLNHLQRSKNTYIIDALQVDSAGLNQGPAGTLKIELKILTYFRKA